MHEFSSLQKHVSFQVKELDYVTKSSVRISKVFVEINESLAGNTNTVSKMSLPECQKIKNLFIHIPLFKNRT